VFNDPVNNTDPSGFLTISPGYPAGAVFGVGDPASLGGPAISGGNIALKLGTGGYIGMHSTSSGSFTGATGSHAATTTPGVNGVNAVGQGEFVRAPVQEGPAAKQGHASARAAQLASLLADGRIVKTMQELFEPWHLDLRTVRIGVRDLGKGVLGVTEDWRTIVINESILDMPAEQRDYLLRRTIAHELAHIQQIRLEGEQLVRLRRAMETAQFGEKATYRMVPRVPRTFEGDIHLGRLFPLAERTARGNPLTIEGIAERVGQIGASLP
jgi:hypothetical protein